MSAILHVHDHVALIVMSAQRQQATETLRDKLPVPPSVLHLLLKDTHPGRSGIFSVSVQWRSSIAGMS